MTTYVAITHSVTGESIADGPLGWGITPFEGNYYISKKYLKSTGFKTSYIPGLCFYKFIYTWLHFVRNDGTKDPMMGWRYVIPNPIFPFIWFRVALPKDHNLISVREYQK